MRSNQINRLQADRVKLPAQLHRAGHAGASVGLGNDLAVERQVIIRRPHTVNGVAIAPAVLVFVSVTAATGAVAESTALIV